MKRMCLILGVASLPLIVVFLGACGSAAKENANILAQVVVALGPFNITVLENGTIEADDPAKITVEEGGKVLYVIDNGSQVTKGQKILAIDSADAEDRHEADKLELTQANTELDCAQQAKKLFLLEANSRLTTAMQTYANAHLAFVQYVEGTAPLRRQSLELSIERAKVALEDASDKAKRMPAMKERGFVTALEVRQALLAEREKQQDLERTKAELHVFDSFEHPQKLVELNGAKEKANLARLQEEQSITSDRARRDGDVAAKEMRVKTVGKKVEKGHIKLAGMMVYAPNDGTILHGDGRRWGDNSSLKVGDDVWAKRVVMRIPDPTRMIANAGVGEGNVNKIRPGMKATIKILALGGKVFQGTVRKVATTPEDDWRRDTKEYPTEITFDLPIDPTWGLRPGIQAEIEILIEHLENVLTIPVDAVEVEKEERFCYVASSTGPIKRNIVLGAVGRSKVVVKEGLKAGETVVIMSSEGTRK